jgi:hypothetical protein
MRSLSALHAGIQYISLIYIIFYNDMLTRNLLSGNKYICFQLIYLILQYFSEIEIESNVHTTALDCL